MRLSDICLANNLFDKIPSPCYVLNLEALEGNLKILRHVSNRSGARVLVALKGYSFWRRFEAVRDSLDGAACSGVNEARLAYEEIGGAKVGKDICVYSPGYKEVGEILGYATHIIFNSFSQLKRFAPDIERRNATRDGCQTKEVSVGLRVNPLYSEVTPPIYNPCTPKSRLGITPKEFSRGASENEELLRKYATGLHFHTHCEQGSEDLKKTLEQVERHFGSYISDCRWINFGGGQHITKKGYNLDLLIELINGFKKKFGVDVYIEPGEAVGWECGDLIGEVVDIVSNEMEIAVLDVSATCHMPDCIEMPYRPACYKVSSGVVEYDCGEKAGRFRYRLGGCSCLAGDIVGDYSFNSRLSVGDKVGFVDMIHYTIVKNTTFNGVELPSLGVVENKSFTLLKKFGYADFKDRN